MKTEKQTIIRITTFFAFAAVQTMVCLPAFCKDDVQDWSSDGDLSAEKYDTAKVWSLGDIIRYALDNNVNVKTKEVTVENKGLALKTTQFSRLPNLNGSISENLNFGRSQNRAGVTEDQNSNNTSVTASTSVPVFEGFKINQQARADKFSLEAARQELEQARQDVSLKVVALYLEVLYNREALSIAREQVDINRRLVSDTRIMVEAGSKTESELYNAQSSLSSSESTLVDAESQCATSMLDLVQAINYPDYRGFDIEIPEMEKALDYAILNITPADSIYDSYLSRRPAIMAAEYSLKAAEREVKIAESKLWPSISLGVTYGTSYYSNQEDLTGQHPGFFEQLNYNGQVIVGASLNIPIFNRMATYNSIRTAKNNVRAQQLSLQQSRIDAVKEVQTAYVNARTAMGKYEAGARSEEAARKAFEYERKKYEAGRSTAYQFDEMRQKYASASLSLLQAGYSLIFRVKILDFYKGNPLY